MRRHLLFLKFEINKGFEPKSNVFSVTTFWIIEHNFNEDFDFQALDRSLFYTIVRVSQSVNFETMLSQAEVCIITYLYQRSVSLRHCRF